MTQPVADPVAQPILDALLAALEEQVALVPDPPATTCLRPGDQVELLMAQGRDECCEGLAWVRLASIYPSTNFPAADETYQKCQRGWGVVVELGVARCAPVGDERRVPSCDEWIAATRNVTADAAAVRRALMRFRTLDEYRHTPHVPGTWAPMTVEGGCVGGSMTVTVYASMCDVLED